MTSNIRQIFSFRNLHYFLIVSILLLLTTKAFLQFSISWDYLAYHLPSALSWYGLTTYEPDDLLLSVIDGFPPLAHITQGALVWATGVLSGANAHNILALIMLAALIAYVFRSEKTLRWFLTGSFAIPLVITQSTSGMVDLFSGCLVTGAFACYLHLCSQTKSFPRSSLVLFVLFASAGMLSKLQAWPAIALLTFAWNWELLQRTRRQQVRIQESLAWCLVSILFVSIWPIRNILLFENPTYPFPPPVLSQFIENAPYPLSGSVYENNVPSYLREASPQRRFFESAFELNRFRTTEDFHWTVDQGVNALSASPHHRMGGWFMASMLLFSFGSIFAFFFGKLPKAPFVAVLSIIAVYASFSQSQEMRYSLFIPLLLSLLVAVSLEHMQATARKIYQIGIFASAGFVLFQCGTGLADFHTLRARDFAPPEAIEYWRKERESPHSSPQKICLTTPHAIYWAGPRFRSFPIKGCR